MARPSCGTPAAKFLDEEITMAVPKSKVTRSKRGMRRAHDALPPASYVEDKQSGNLRRNHHIDLKAGTYNGRQVLPPEED